MNDLLPLLEVQLPPPGDSYSQYSLGILLGILAVALNLAIAVVAAVNAALASHLSLRPEQKDPNIEACLIICMIVLFGTAVISGTSGKGGLASELPKAAWVSLETVKTSKAQRHPGSCKSKSTWNSIFKDSQSNFKAAQSTPKDT